MSNRRAGLVTACLCAFGVGRLLILLGGKVFTSHDSAVYAYRPDPSLNHGPLVSFTGHAPREWGVPLFNAMFSTDYARAVGQWTLGTVAWAILALAVAAYLQTLAAKAVAMLGILGLGLLRAVASWDFAILSESLSLSLGVLTLAFLLLWLRNRSGWWLLATVMTSIWWTFVRPDIRFFTIVLLIVFAVTAWRWRTGPSPKVWQAVAAAVAVALSLVWYQAIAPTIDKTFLAYSGTALPVDRLSVAEEHFVYRLRVDVSTDAELKQTFRDKLGMPSCPGTDAFDSRPAWDTVEFAENYRRCPELKAWGEQHQHSFWPGLLRAAPDQFMRKFTMNLSQMFGGEAYATTDRALPAWFEKAVFPSQRYGLPVALIGLLIALALALFTGARRVTPILINVSLIASASALGSAMLSVWLASGEYRRFGIQETMATRLAMVIFVACALEAYLVRRRATTPPNADLT
jgi:hypothetical protein